MKTSIRKYIAAFLTILSMTAYGQDTSGVEVKSRLMEINVGYGYMRNDYSQLNQYLQSSGYSGVSQNIGLFSVGISAMAKRLVFSYELQLFSSPTQTNTGNINMSTNGWGTELMFGYQIIKKARFRFYPYVGIGDNFTSLNIEDNTTQTSLNGLMAAQKNNATVSFTNYAVDLGLKADFMINRPGDTECPQISRYMAIGIKAGYYIRLTNSPHADYNNQQLDNNPPVGMSGPYVRAVIGFGRKIKEVNWK